MRTFIVDWLTKCPKCGSKESEAKTLKGTRTSLWPGDDIKCLRCGQKGEIDTLEGHAWVIWDEVEDD